MSIKFEYLPTVILGQVFDYLHPQQLFEVCSLNKYFFLMISKKIYSNLSSSVYLEDSKYSRLQLEFIKLNSKKMRFITIFNDDELPNLTLCNNIRSLSIDYDVDITQLKLSSSSNSFPNLKKLDLYGESNNYQSNLLSFKYLFNQIESFSIQSDTIDVDIIVNYFNEEKLKYLTIISNSDISNSHLTQLRNKFVNLKYFLINDGSSDQTFYSDYVLFLHSTNKFKINTNVYIDYLSGIEGLLDYDQIYFNADWKEVDKNIFDKVDKKKVRALGYMTPSLLHLYNLNLFPKLSKIIVRARDDLKEILDIISSIPGITTLEIDFTEANRLIRLKCFEVINHEDQDEYCSSLIQYKTIEKLVIKYSQSYLQDVLNILCLFPSIQLVSLSNCYFVDQDFNDINIEFNELIYFQFNNIMFHDASADLEKLKSSLSRNPFIEIIN
ncbi:hypothetical protein K502DRAFT_326333 [Neoconidiobolus thromboides FSU 785]|nr:hypothetical protein K502DRAFT_326333 [Neoconidiobolus thromboides FSU 785]